VTAPITLDLPGDARFKEVAALAEKLGEHVGHWLDHCNFRHRSPPDGPIEIRDQPERLGPDEGGLVITRGPDGALVVPPPP
jgi:hypothetical protein